MISAHRRLYLARLALVLAAALSVFAWKCRVPRVEHHADMAPQTGMENREPAAVEIEPTAPRAPAVVVAPDSDPGPRLANSPSLPSEKVAAPSASFPAAPSIERSLPEPVVVTAPAEGLPQKLRSALARLQGEAAELDRDVFAEAAVREFAEEGESDSVTSLTASATGALPRSNAKRLIDDPLHHNAATFLTPAGTQTVLLAGVSGAGSFAGPGSIEFAGGYAPGNSPAIIILASQTIFASTNVLTMEIGGLSPGPGVPIDNGYDQLIFTSALTPQVSWGGTLVVDLINNFAPVVGQSFNLFDFDPTRDTGVFEMILVQDHGLFAPGLSFDFGQLYVTGMITVVPEPGFALFVAVGALIGATHRRRARY